MHSSMGIEPQTLIWKEEWGTSEELMMSQYGVRLSMTS